MNDHGESCLAIGFPLISMPPSGDETGARGTSRVLAPLLLMPVNLQVRTGSRMGVTIECVGEGTDLLVANPALIAWLERRSGRMLGEIYLDDDAIDPWREVEELLEQINTLLALETPPAFRDDTLLEIVQPTEKLPKTMAVVPSAVLGLFPLSNQSLLRDTRWMLENEAKLHEPVSAFLNPQALHEREPSMTTDAPVSVVQRDFAGEWLVSAADPCQANAVLAAREAKALVVHGPPGTGKSQTITNMIADHLARGERVLFVCDKRTALDVVKYRLDAVGLGDLCGVVHDPSGDRKDFYMGLRAKLENLADTPPANDPRSRLATTNQQLTAIHAELEGYRRKLQVSGIDAAQGFHELLGLWLGYALRQDLPGVEAMPGLLPYDLEMSTTTLDEICRRAQKAAYPTNSFRGLAGISLADLMARTGDDVRATLEALCAAGAEAESVRPAKLVAVFDAKKSLDEQSALRVSTAALLRKLAGEGIADFARAVATLPETRANELRVELDDVGLWLKAIRADALDRTLLSSARNAGVLTLAIGNQHLASLIAWEAVADSFFKRLMARAAKQSAAATLAPLGLALGAWQQGMRFYRGLRIRLLVADWLSRVTGLPAGLPGDTAMCGFAAVARTVWDAQVNLVGLGCGEILAEIAAEKAALEKLADALERESTWALSLDHLLKLVRQSGLFSGDAAGELLPRWLGNESSQDTTRSWLAHAATLEDVVRLNHSLRQLPSGLHGAVEKLIGSGVAFDELLACLNRHAVENVLRHRLKSDPELASMDGERIEAAFDSFLKLSGEKLRHVSDYVRFLWVHHQKTRLLSTTGTQLNKLGSGLRQRLYVKGKKALKLRQMLATGADTEGGDPIYDLCPVWMASPSTVAQIFPRHPIFDVVIFDEASQCRLEEALPVMLRGKRVVIAGDQKQLPPTRFFESALADSGNSDAETADELFYQQQSEAEDLLTSALNLDVCEAYLDVHYRSRNEALIGFSNEHYYGSRLQPIPGHPRNKALSAPIRVHRVDGIYADRTNGKEAEAAVNLIAELLADPEPPSIGIACFNLTQKEAIIDAIAGRVSKDADFARRYDEAKGRKGRDSFEGLFVKNLENVQGDERDVMIISTTFGPDVKGKFRRNFGALSQREGGRRLNVLVTRARDAVHVLTSIPVAEYMAVEALPPGQVTNGRLQLYAYLRYAEGLAVLFTEHQEKLEQMRRDTTPELKVWESATPSPLAASIGAALLGRHQTGSQVHWGNEGFCVDVACVHPLMPADVTVGVLTDFSRFHKTPDPIEWDIFRTRVLRSQGWELQRVWSPVIFRRAEEMLQRIQVAHERLSAPSAPHELRAETSSN